MAAKNSALLIFSLVLLSVAAMATPLVVNPIVTIKVQGSIVCVTPNETTPILGATAKVECQALSQYRTMRPYVIISQPTDTSGVYLITFPRVISTGERLIQCKAFLNASPLLKCNLALDLNLGITGAPLHSFRLLDNGVKMATLKPFAFTTPQN